MRQTAGHASVWYWDQSQYKWNAEISHFSRWWHDPQWTSWELMLSTSSDTPRRLIVGIQMELVGLHPTVHLTNRMMSTMTDAAVAPNHWRRREAVCRPGKTSVLPTPPIRSVLHSGYVSGFWTWGCEPTLGVPSFCVSSRALLYPSFSPFNPPTPHPFP